MSMFDVVTQPTQNDNLNAFAIPLTESIPHQDMFEQLTSLQKAVKTVEGCTKVLDVINKGIEKSISMAEDHDKALNLCKGLVERGFQNVKTQIVNYEEMSKSPNAMPNGSTCKETDAIAALFLQSKRFENLFEDLVKIELTAKNLTSENFMNFSLENFDSMKQDLANVTSQVKIASKDFEDIETQTLNILARLGPTIRNTDPSKIEPYKEILNHYSKIALIKNQFETHLLILAAKIDLLRPGKDLSEKMKSEVTVLSGFENNGENTEVKGVFKYNYIKKEKEESFKELVKSATENFSNITAEAKLYKVQLQEVLNKKVILINEQFSKDLANGVKEQLDINATSFVEANNKITSLHTELLKDINEIWSKVTEAQKQFYTKLKQVELTIQTKTDDELSEMYYISETRAAWTVEAKGLLNTSVLAKEEELVVKAEEELVEAKETK